MQGSRQDTKVIVITISRHICYLLNIGEGKFWFSLPDELTVKKVFYVNKLSQIYDRTLCLFLKGNSAYYGDNNEFVAEG